MADIDIDLATRAMFNFDLEGCAEVLFARHGRRQEYETAGKMVVS